MRAVRSELEDGSESGYTLIEIKAYASRAISLSFSGLHESEARLVRQSEVKGRNGEATTKGVTDCPRRKTE